MDKHFTAQFGFPTTQWSLLTRASDPDPETRAPALEELCRIYWPPLYAFVRSKGVSHSEAEDLTQGFFAEIIAKSQLENVDADRGRLRSYLLGGISKYTAKQWRDDHRQKRGGHATVFSLDHPAASEQHSILDLTNHQTPESSFERQWALTVIEHTLSKVASDYEARDQSDIFEALKFAITPGEEHRHYKDVATQTGLSVTAVKTRIFRLRARFVRELRKTVADTLTDEKEIDEEIRRLMAIFK